MYTKDYSKEYSKTYSNVRGKTSIRDSNANVYMHHSSLSLVSVSLVHTYNTLLYNRVQTQQQTQIFGEREIACFFCFNIDLNFPTRQLISMSVWDSVSTYPLLLFVIGTCIFHCGPCSGAFEALFQSSKSTIYTRHHYRDPTKRPKPE